MQVTDTANSVSKSVIKDISLVSVLGLLTISLLSFAVINLVAANWSSMSADMRLVLAQSVFVLVILIAFTTCWRHKTLADYTVQLAALATGALLALIGQIYQTGADTWLLFALWALLITPWLILLRTVFITTLWALLINITIILYASSSPILMLWLLDSNLLLVVVNICLLLAVLCLQKHMQDKWALLRKIFAGAALVFLFLYMLQSQFYDFGADLLITYVLAYGGLLLAYIWFSKKQSDLLIISMVFLAAIAIFGLLFFQLSEDISVILLMAVFVVIATFFASLKLLKMWRAWYPAKTTATGSIPWYFYVLRIAALSLSAALIIIWFIFSFDIFSSDELMYLSYGLLLIGLCIAKPVELNHKNRTDISASLLYEAALVLLIAGLGLYLIASLFESYDTNNVSSIWYLVLISIVVYLLLNNFITRFAAAITLLIACLWAFNISEFIFGDIPADLWSISASYFVCLFLLAAFYLRSRAKTYWHPVAAALMVCVLPLAIGMDLLNSIPVWRWPLAAILASLAPALLAWFFVLRLFKQNNKYSARHYLVASLLLLSILGMFNAFTLLFGLSLMSYAFTKRMQALAVWSVIIIISGLVLYYFQDSTSLVFKALQFAVIALGLFIAVLLMRASNNSNGSVFYLRTSKTYLSVLLAGAVLIIGMVNYQIRSYENILQNGTKVVLELAPVDPRSLMQGDYMELNYVIRREANNLLFHVDQSNIEIKENNSYWLILRANDDNIWHLYAVSDSYSEAAGIIDNNPDMVILKAKLHASNLDWGANSWFFTEGSGDKYAKAKFGVLSIDKSGMALISGLLDKNMQPIK